MFLNGCAVEHRFVWTQVRMSGERQNLHVDVDASSRPTAAHLPGQLQELLGRHGCVQVSSVKTRVASGVAVRAVHTAAGTAHAGYAACTRGEAAIASGIDRALRGTHIHNTPHGTTRDARTLCRLRPTDREERARIGHCVRDTVPFGPA